MTEIDPEGGVSRRTLLRGATVAGTLVWSAPLMSVGSTAYATGTPSTNGSGTGFSFVALLITYKNVLYRIKYDFNGTMMTHEVGPSFKIGNCTTRDNTGLQRNGAHVNKADPTVPSGPTAHDAPIQEAKLLPNGDWRITFLPGVTVDDWVVHQGQCCLEMPPPGASNASYPITVTQTTTGSGPNKVVTSESWTYPKAPNKSPCSLAVAPGGSSGTTGTTGSTGSTSGTTGSTSGTTGSTTGSTGSNASSGGNGSNGSSGGKKDK